MSEIYVEHSLAERLRIPFAVALAIAAVVQVRLPVGAAGTTLAGSDAVVAFALPVLLASRTASLRRLNSVPGLTFWLAATTAALAVGLAIGIARVGVQTWAVIRIVGWIAVIGHLVVAAWIAASQQARDLALRVFVIAAAASIAVDLVKFVRGSVLIFMPNCNAWVDDTMGLMRNPNAYGFVLLLAFTVLASRLQDRILGRPGFQIAAGSTLVFALILSASRSAWIAALPVIGVLLVTGMAPRVRLLAIVLGGTLAAALFLGMLTCGPRGAVTRDASMLANAVTHGLGTQALEEAKDAPNIERFYTYRRAIELFQAHPILGAGIGTFLSEETARGNPPLIIHSTTLWLLAETGIVGLGAFLGLGVAVVAFVVGRVRTGDAADRTDAATALLAIMAFGVMTQAQELLYQRSLWILLGLLVFHLAPAERPAELAAPRPYGTQ